MRVFLAFEIDADVELTVLWARRLVASPKAVHLHGLLPEATDLEAEHDKSLAALERLQDLIWGWCPHSSYALDRGLNATAMRNAIVEEQAGLAVFGPLLGFSGLTRASLMMSLAFEHHIETLSVGAGAEKTSAPLTRLGCQLDSHATGFGAVAAFMQGRDAELVIKGRRQAQIVELASAFGLREPRFEPAPGVDLTLLPGDAITDVSARGLAFIRASELQTGRIPTLFLARTRAEVPLTEETFAVSDTLILPGLPPKVALDRVSMLGQSTPFCGVVTLRDGQPLMSDDGIVTLPTQTDTAFVVRFGDTAMAAARAHVVRKPLQLIDAHAPKTPVAPGCEPIYVRLRSNDALPALREHLPSGSILIDASAWLDDAHADDVPRAVDAQRLARLGLRLRGAATSTLDAELDLVSGSQLVAGHRMAFELDNGRARRSVLAAIDGAQARVHWQCYIVETDPVSARFADALTAAAARGVAVRLLVDSLYSRHGSFGATNPVLTVLQATPGIEVRMIAPLTGWPTLTGLKLRNHRKMIIIDGQDAVVSGRNIGAPYYTGFDEVALSRASLYREVPWLDCGARIAGPLVAAIEEAFVRDWVAAGGEAFSVQAQAEKGGLAARLVLHQGLADTHTLDAQLALIRHARERLMIVNTFPLLLEIQHALIAAVRRGVVVQVLFGNVRPRYGAGIPFTGGAVRQLADQLVRSRLDALIAAGGEAYELKLAPQPAWEKELGAIMPHVHAKVLVCDDRAVAMGSANLDVTAAYWESEALLIAQNGDFVRRVKRALDALIATSHRIDPKDPSWQGDASQRAWLSRNWPSLIS